MVRSGLGRSRSIRAPPANAVIMATKASVAGVADSPGSASKSARPSAIQLRKSRRTHRPATTHAPATRRARKTWARSTRDRRSTRGVCHPGRDRIHRVEPGSGAAQMTPDALLLHRHVGAPRRRPPGARRLLEPSSPLRRIGYPGSFLQRHSRRRTRHHGRVKRGRHTRADGK